MRFIDRRQERKELKQNHQRRGERAHQGKPIRGTNNHVEKRDRPRDKNDYFKQVRDRTTAFGMTAGPQECGLKNEAEADDEEVELPWPKNPTAHFENRVRDRHEKTGR